MEDRRIAALGTTPTTTGPATSTPRTGDGTRTADVAGDRHEPPRPPTTPTPAHGGDAGDPRLVPLPVVLPLLGAALTLLLGRRPRGRSGRVSLTVLAAVLAVAVALLLVADRAHGPLAVEVGGWPAPLGIVLVADRLAALMLVVSAAVTLVRAGLLHRPGHGRRRTRRPRCRSSTRRYLVLTAGVANAFLAGDLFNLYVGFEILLAASYVLLTLGGTETRDPGRHHLRRGQPALAR